MTKKDLVRMLKNVDDDTPIYIYCSYNCYNVKQIVNWDQFVVLNVGEANNPELIEHDGPIYA